MSAECSSGNIPPGYKQTEVGVIPEDWNIQPLGSLADVTMGQSPVGSSYNKSGIGLPLINGPTEFTKKYPVKVQWTSEPTKTCRKDDLLLCVRGSSTGRTNVSNDEYCIGRGIAAIRAKPSSNTAYLTYQIHLGIEELLTLSAGSTFPNVDGKSIRSIQIPVPPTKAEQETIAEALSDTDALIESLEHLIAKKRQIKQGAMHELLTGKRRLPGFSGEWEIKQFGSVLKFQVGFPFSSSFFNEAGQGIRLVKNRDLKCDDQVFHYSGKIGDEFLVQDGDLLVGMDGDFLPCLWTKGPALLNQRVGRIVELPGLNRVFAFYYLIEPLKEIENVTSSTTVKHLSHGDIEGIEKPLPCIEEQTAIATILSDMDSEITALEEKLAKASQIKQGMMQELLTGRIRLL